MEITMIKTRVRELPGLCWILRQFDVVIHKEARLSWEQLLQEKKKISASNVSCVTIRKFWNFNWEEFN